MTVYHLLQIFVRVLLLTARWQQRGASIHVVEHLI
jgi:hypothetical protein